MSNQQISQMPVNNCNNSCVKAQPGKLLEFVTAVPVPAIETFKASDHFKEDTKQAAVRIFRLGDNFKKHFLGQNEGSSKAQELKIHKLLEPSVDAPVIAELADKCETTLGQFFHLLSKQGKGEAGPRLTNGWANIAYIRDVDGNLWAVGACWRAESDGWCVEAHSVDDPEGWRGGRQALSR